MSDERREFVRSEGTIYLHIALPPATGELAPRVDHPPVLPTKLDLAGVLLMNFHGRLDYESPEGADYTRQLLRCLEAVHAGGPKHFERLDVVISGSGIEFPSRTTYATDTALAFQLAFPGYPFAVMSLRGRVVHCCPERTAGEASGYRVGCAFEEIPEEERDLIIKFVHYLQRQQLLKRQHPEDGDAN